MKWRASHILVSDHLLAEKIIAELQQGADFFALARKHSTCSSKKKGGDLGWFGPRAMIPAFENAVKRLGMDQISRPVRTQFGTHIIKKTGQR